MIHPDTIKLQVREHYAARLATGRGCCGDGASSCCAPAVDDASAALQGFEGPSLGCGAPLRHAGLQPGEIVVDLGSGAGREALLAAGQVGPEGRAIGVDMTPEMIHRARENARATGTANAEFRLGEIEHLPLADGQADVVISNCVINLVPDKAAAFREAHRVLRPGGRLVVSDIVTNGPLPPGLRESAEAWAACVAGALDLDAYLAAVRSAGFADVEVLEPATAGDLPILSVTIRAVKPR